MSDVVNCSGSCESCGENCNENNALSITLTLDNNEQLECAILTIFQIGEKDYIALLPKNEDGENGEVYIYRFHEEASGPVLENIETDDEYEAAADAFDEWLDSLEYQELAGAEDLEGIVEAE